MRVRLPVTVGEKGRFFIPKALRDELDIRPGDTVMADGPWPPGRVPVYLEAKGFVVEVIRNHEQEE